MTAHFGERMVAAVRSTGTCAVVGLDPHLDRLPASLRQRYEGKKGHEYRIAAAEAVAEFNRIVIDTIRGLVPAVKPQFAFYEQLGAPGFAALEDTCAAAKDAGLLIIGDAKRGDIASTAAAYARATLDPSGPFGCDSVTVNPWMGPDTLEPFMSVCMEHHAGLFVLVRTTNPGSAFLQHHGSPTAADQVADVLAELGGRCTGPSGFSSVGAVVGAMTGDDARALRDRMPTAWFLVPGVGAQGGSAEDAIAGARADGLGCLINSSRGVLYPSSDALQAYDIDPREWIFQSAKSHSERFKFDV